MFILTGTSGQYEDQTFTTIAVSNNKQSLENLILKIEESRNLYNQRKSIINSYINEDSNNERIRQAKQQELISKDHLPVTASKERYEINLKNQEIKRRNYDILDKIHKTIIDEAEEIAKTHVPMTEEQEKWMLYICESYSIDEIEEVS